MTQQTPNRIAQQAQQMQWAGQPMSHVTQQLAMMTNAPNTVFPQQMPIVEPQVDWSTKIAEVMREQFGLRPKQQSIMYKTPYPPAYDQIPVPHKYKMPDFTKFDITKADKIFDLLLSEGLIKLKPHHKIPSEDELKNIKVLQVAQRHIA